MARYAKIDRATGNVLKVREFNNPDRVFNKTHVWIEIVQNATPAYNPDTHKLVRTVTQSDLSDLQVDVDPSEKRVLGYNVVALNAGELQVVTDGKVSATNDQLFDAVELLYTYIAQNPGVAPVRASFPNGLWNKLNNRRALKGLPPI